MIAPLPLFAVREWGIRHQDGQVCDVCGTGAMVASEICPHCFGTLTTVTGTHLASDGSGSLVTECHCTLCGTDFEETGRSRLECRSCGAVALAGWRRHHFDTEAPMYIGGTLVGGELYATVQHYVARPGRDERDPYHLADFVIDIDRGGDLEEAVTAALAYADFLDEHDAYYRLFFSGSKGFHLQVPFQNLGANPHELLNSRLYKRFAQELQDQVGHELDMAIYSRRRMLRVEGSFHAKTGLYKVGLDRETLASRRSSVIDLAKTPPSAPFILGSGIVQQVKKGTPLSPLYTEAVRGVELEATSPNPAPIVGMTFGGHPSCIETALSDGAPAEGTRHQLSFNVAAYWVANGLPDEEFVAWADAVPGHSDTPRVERVQEASSTLRWAHSNRPGFRCRTMQDLGICDPKCPFYTGTR